MILKRFGLLLILAILMASCGSSKKSTISAKNPGISTAAEPENHKAYKIVANAQKFEGTPYKYGGTTKKGMDCSGLVYVSFLEEDIPLPRTSRDLSLQGKRLFLKEVTIGDLLFFETDKNRKVINHVGLVVDVLQDQILFIHSSTSRGVIISSLSENYWQQAFVMARRLL